MEKKCYCCKCSVHSDSFKKHGGSNRAFLSDKVGVLCCNCYGVMRFLLTGDYDSYELESDKVSAVTEFSFYTPDTIRYQYMYTSGVNKILELYNELVLT